MDGKLFLEIIKMKELSDARKPNMAAELDWYILKDGNPVRVTYEEFLTSLPNEGKDDSINNVARTNTINGEVHTDFVRQPIGRDVNGRPLLFESIIFGGTQDGYTRPYATREEAIMGHTDVVQHAIDNVQKD
jgi:hypothetical protein